MADFQLTRGVRHRPIPGCICTPCVDAARLRARAKRARRATGTHACGLCAARFNTLHGLRAHRGRRHPGEIGRAA